VSAPLVSLDQVSLAFGHLPLLERSCLQIESGERIAVIGRNGAGKSTLLRLIAGTQAPDAGTVWKRPNLRVATLEQDVPLASTHTVFDVVAEGLGGLAQVVADYHHVALQVATNDDPKLLTRLGELQHELEERDGWRLEQRVELVLTTLGLPQDAIVETLSGGWRRRVRLARTLVGEPDVLLLDEPTNHLDIESITWLETFLTQHQGAVVFVTHDRAFLQNVATRIVEVDRGELTSWPGDYENYLRRQEERRADREIHEEKFDKLLAREEVWLRRGVKARRTRDEGRVKALLDMRRERAARRDDPGLVSLKIENAGQSGRMVIEVEHVSKSFDGRPIVRDFSCRILRGDRIGLIGPNGSGKTTFLRMLLGQLTPDAGDIRLGANVEIAYYDQQREQLDPERTVFETIGEGNDSITVNGRTRHVHAYLRDFLFPLERAYSPVGALSGGERNRLLLARLFSRPANLLVLDEPTNDLDLETLELLEAQLLEWTGTLLLVSHDRAFLEHIVTSTYAFDGRGGVREYVGGYEDWLRQRASEQATLAARTAAAVGAANAGAGAKRESGSPASPSGGAKGAPTARSTAAGSGKKLSYKERLELEALPAKIEALETEQRDLNDAILRPTFYREPPDQIAATLARIEAIGAALAACYQRWDALESRPG
jgi:ATP-binding cassette subfamily F protein uup